MWPAGRGLDKLDLEEEEELLHDSQAGKGQRTVCEWGLEGGELAGGLGPHHRASIQAAAGSWCGVHQWGGLCEACVSNPVTPVADMQMSRRETMLAVRHLKECCWHQVRDRNGWV